MSENKLIEECLTKLFKCYLENGDGGIHSLGVPTNPQYVPLASRE